MLDDRGSVQAEYVVMLALVSLALALAMATLGLPLYRLFIHQQAWMLLPIA